MSRLFPHIEVADLSTDGRGIARLEDGKVVFVKDAIPGDVITLQLLGKRRKVWEGRVETLEQASSQRARPLCQHFGVCGGCRNQHMRYDAQLTHKQKWVADALTRIGKLELPSLQPILAAPEAYGYRNKLEYSFSAKRWLTSEEVSGQAVLDKSPALGFHVPGVFDKVVQIDHCHLQPDPGNAIRNRVHQWARAQGIAYYDNKAHTGLLRNLLIRSAQATSQLMVLPIVAATGPWLDELLALLRTEFPQITSLGYMVNSKLNDSYHDLEPVFVYGQPYIEEHLGPWRFQVGPKSFFQTNTRQAKQLYQQVYDLLPAELPLLYDLYCGTGSIGIYVSGKARRIVGVEYVEAAVADARVNAGLNHLRHLDFVAGDMAKVLNPDFVRMHGRPDAVITDPPRAGMDAAVVQALLQLAPQTVVYVSCNPATQARDLALMADAYTVDHVQPVDMFPQTPHVENIVRLQLR
ncbi:MAG: 23S rRNA (uracil(1939)-C(5))-methyltransferase RlmD [Bacteroidetes bacterium]|nr:23S rRNA (uracil(1939)-C(5))-methyltransferase RlmD [Bacteroidota bacterium]